MANVNWTALLGELKKAGKEALKGLVEDVADDVAADGFATELAAIMVDALRANDESIMAEAKANIPWLLEKHRLHAANVTNETIGKVFETLQKGASIGLSALLAAL